MKNYILIGLLILILTNCTDEDIYNDKGLSFSISSNGCVSNEDEIITICDDSKKSVDVNIKASKKVSYFEIDVIYVFENKDRLTVVESNNSNLVKVTFLPSISENYLFGDIVAGYVDIYIEFEDGSYINDSLKVVFI